MRIFCASVLVFTVAVFSAVAQFEKQPDSIGNWIALLGSPQYKQREAATLALDKCGAAALPALRAALRSSDLEVRRRAALLIEHITYRIESARGLAGSKIHLVYQEVPVLEAVKDFAAKAGVAIEVDGNGLGLAGRRITLDTGEATFWEAFELFCVKAGLSHLGSERPQVPVIHEGDVPFFNLTRNPVPKKPRLALTDAKTAPKPMTSFGGVRLRAELPVGSRKHGSGATKGPGPDHVGFLLEVMPEPRMLWHGLVGLSLTHAVDDKGQKLVQPQPYLLERVTDPLLGGEGIGIWTDDTSLGIHDQSEYRHLVARLVPGKEPSLLLKEVRGMVTALIMANRPLVQVDDVMAAAGKEFAGPEGCLIKVQEVKREDRQLTLSVLVSNKTGSAWLKQGVLVRTDAGGEMSVDPTLGFTSFVLKDSGGKELATPRVEHVYQGNNQGDPCLWASYVLTFALPDSTTVPASLSYKGMQVMTVDIPFALRDVPLCDDPLLPAPQTGFILHIIR